MPRWASEWPVIYRRCRRSGRRLRTRGRRPARPLRGIVYDSPRCSASIPRGGFAVQSLLALWLFERFGLSLSEASVFFLWSGVLSAFSFPVAAWLAGRMGS